MSDGGAETQLYPSRESCSSWELAVDLVSCLLPSHAAAGPTSTHRRKGHRFLEASGACILLSLPRALPASSLHRSCLSTTQAPCPTFLPSPCLTSLPPCFVCCT